MIAKSIVASAIILMFGMGVAHAGVSEPSAAQKSQIKAAVERNTEGKIVVDAVNKTPIPGFFEITSGLDIFYVDAQGQYAMVEGNLMDLRTKENLTANRLDKLSRVDFASLPFNLAIKTVQGTGKRAIAIFEDPTCPVCKSLHKFIAQLPDVTVYTFVYPIASPEAIPIARAAWCSPNKAVAWEQAMSGNLPSTARASCDTSALEKIQTLGDKLKVAGTPTVFLGNGRRLVGATPPDQFVQALNEVAPPSVN